MGDTRVLEVLWVGNDFFVVMFIVFFKKLTLRRKHFVCVCA